MVKKTRAVERKIFVEGGGDHNRALKTECRRAFSQLFDKSGLSGRMPRIIVCGSRSNAYDQFCTALRGAGDDDVYVLLVDSEAPVTAPAADAKPWAHVKNRRGDGWERPAGAEDDQLHFMVECMESWFLADRPALARFFGSRFLESRLPGDGAVEAIPKASVFSGLKEATRGTPKKAYGKGAHSFKILGEIDPRRVMKAAPYARRLLNHLDRVL